MRTTIDAGGRVVIPKEFRDALQLKAGQAVDIAFVDGRISIDVSGVGMHLDVHDDGLPVAVAEDEVDQLSAETVRATVEQLRR